MTAVEAIGELFAGPGARDYLGELVTIGTHMLQAGALAEAAGADPPLVAAAPRSRRRGSRTSRRYLEPWSDPDSAGPGGRPPKTPPRGPGPGGRPPDSPRCARVRDSALTAVELCTLNATALPK